MADKNNYLGFNFGDFSDPTNRTTGVPTKYLNLKGLTDFWAQIKSYIDAQDQNLFSSITSNSNKTLTIQGNGNSLGTYNGLEAKTINITPTSIGAAPASHTHNYLPLAGGTMTGVINSQSIIPKTTNTYDLGSSSYKWKNVYATTLNGDLNGSLLVKDIRELTGVTSDFTQKAFNPFFSNVTMPTSNWWSGFTSKGWTNDYNSWQLVGFSGQGDASTQDLYYRAGVNDVWNSWKKILDNSNTTYTPTVTSSTSGAYQIGTLKIGDTETILYGKDTNTTYTSLKNPYSLTIQGNGTTIDSYDGSVAKTINITPENIGALSKGTDATKVVLGDGSLKPISDFVTGTINETTISYADGILSMNFSDANVISYDNGTLNLTL